MPNDTPKCQAIDSLTHGLPDADRATGVRVDESPSSLSTELGAVAREGGRIDPSLERAFREWCAVLGMSSNRGQEANGYRLARTADGRVQIERALANGSVEIISAPMTPSSFCEAVQLVRASFGIKTVLVARSVASRMGRNGGRLRSGR